MQEAVLHVPLRYNDGREIETTKLDVIEKKIIYRYGSYTRSLQCEGHTITEQGKPMRRYTIPMKNTEGNIWFLQSDIGLYIKRNLDQETVYMVLPSGEAVRH
jgi:hypothetical protein